MKTCRPDDALAEVAQKMSEHAVGSVQVIADDGGVISTITDLDIAIAASIEGRKLIDLTVREAMFREPSASPLPDRAHRRRRHLRY